jgi:dynein heavy chain
LCTGKRDLQFEKVISDVTGDMKLTRDDDFTLRVVQLSELLAIRHCVFLLGPTGSGRTEVYKVGGAAGAAGGGCCCGGAGVPECRLLLPHPVLPQVLAQAIARGCDTPLNDYLKVTNRKKVVIRDIDPKAVSTQDLYGFVNMATREWKVRAWWCVAGLHCC